MYLIQLNKLKVIEIITSNKNIISTTKEMINSATNLSLMGIVNDPTAKNLFLSGLSGIIIGTGILLGEMLLGPIIIFALPLIPEFLIVGGIFSMVSGLIKGIQSGIDLNKSRNSNIEYLQNTLNKSAESFNKENIQDVLKSLLNIVQNPVLESNISANA